jgi:hypothetical protein
MDARQAHSFQLVPGIHRLAPSTGDTIAFSVTTLGTVDYNTNLDDILDGRGTSTLLFRSPMLELFLLFIHSWM